MGRSVWEAQGWLGDEEERVSDLEQWINRVHQGDCLTVMREMPSAMVQCIVTSPPYWMLRDYGVDGQIGLERTPEEYVAKLVEVFREARRLLRDDGVLWLNLGSSYANSNGGRSWELNAASGHTDNLGKIGRIKHGASCDKSPTRSPLLQRVPACGTDGKAPQDFQSSDLSCSCSCDAPQGETQSHHDRSAHSDRYAQPNAMPTLLKDRDTEHLGCDQASRRAFVRDALESTTLSSARNAPGALSPSGESSACQPEHHSSFGDAHPCADRADCTSCTSRMLPPLVVRTVGKESFFSACGRSDCKGIGYCGLCWCYLTIPTLNVKPKDELNIPHLVAMALQADGWILRQTIIWAKPNCMPESVTDRCTKNHEYIFMLAKSKRYFFDAESIKENAVSELEERKRPNGLSVEVGKKTGAYRPNCGVREMRNKRSVWAITTQPFKEAHFATFPEKLIEPCILAGSRVGDSVLDMFGGSGTTGAVASRLGRRYVLVEANPAYVAMCQERIKAATAQLNMWHAAGVSNP